MGRAAERYLEGSINEHEFTREIIIANADLNDTALGHEPADPKKPYYGCREEMPEVTVLANALVGLAAAQ